MKKTIYNNKNQAMITITNSIATKRNHIMADSYHDMLWKQMEPLKS